MAKWEGQQLNEAKRRLAYEVTKLVHGEEEAKKAQSAAEAVFGGGSDNSNMPTTAITKDEAKEINILDLMLKAGLIPSKGEGRRLVQQGGVSVNGNKVSDIAQNIYESDYEDGCVIIKKGKKVFHKIVIEG